MSRKSELTFILVVVTLCLCVVLWLMNVAKEDGEKKCAELGATAHFTSKEMQYFCVTPDGRIIG